MDVSIIKITDKDVNCLENKSSTVYKVPNDDDILMVKVNADFEDRPSGEVINNKLKNVNGVCDVDIYLCNELLLESSLFNNEKEAPIVTIEKIEDAESNENNERELESFKNKSDFIYECDECTNVTYKSLEMFLEHKKKSHSKQLFPCNSCHLSFEKQATLKYHTLAKHGNIQDLIAEAQKNKSAEKRGKKKAEKQKNGKNECNECHLMFWKNGDLEAHIEKVHHGQFEKRTETEHICRKCNKAYESQVSFLNHLDQHKFILKFGCKELQCRECEVWFHTILDLMIHIQKEHSNQGKFLLCPKDNKLFTDEESFRNHMETHNSNAVFQCAQCIRSFSEKSLLFKHLEDHSEFRCYICMLSFTSKIGLTIHERKHKVEGRHKCGICKKKFSFKKDFKIHCKTHAKDILYQCTVCNKYFQGQSALAAHSKLHDKEKIFNCKKCSETFTTSSDYLAHEKTHAIITFECKDCNVKFASKKLLGNHTKQHNKLRFDCSKCNMVFIGLKSYQAHAKLRCGVSPKNEKRGRFNCDACGEKFKRVNEYVEHWKKHTKQSKDVENYESDFAEEDEKV